MLKAIILESRFSNVEALTIYSEILLSLTKYDKAFIYLNHALKIEYRDPLLW